MRFSPDFSVLTPIPRTCGLCSVLHAVNATVCWPASGTSRAFCQQCGHRPLRLPSLTLHCWPAGPACNPDAMLNRVNKFFQAKTGSDERAQRAASLLTEFFEEGFAGKVVDKRCGLSLSVNTAVPAAGSLRWSIQILLYPKPGYGELFLFQI
jgi:hypothetical protein